MRERIQSPFELLRDFEFLSLTSVQLARGISRSTILIALALYADMFAATGIVIGLFGSAYGLSRLLFVLPMGRYIDLGNSKYYLIGGLVMNGFVVLGFIFVQSSSHLIGIRFFQGLSAVTIFLAGTAIVGQIAGDEERGLWIGTYKQMKAFSSLVGDLTGGVLLFVYGFEFTYLVLFVITGVAVVVVVSFLRSNPGNKIATTENTGIETLRKLLARKTVLVLVVFRLTFSFSKEAVKLFLPIYARTEFGMSAIAIAGILAGGKLTKALTQGYVGTISDRIGRLPWFIISGAYLFGIGVVLIPGAELISRAFSPVQLTAFGSTVMIQSAFFALSFAYFVMSLADSVRMPASNTLFVNEGGRVDSVATSLSLRSFPGHISSIAGPIVIGSLVDFLSYPAAFGVAAGIAVISGTLVALHQLEILSAAKSLKIRSKNR